MILSNNLHSDSRSNGCSELGPHLAMAEYHAMERWHPERIGAMALYCSDGRWGEAFDEFCHRHLHIPHYDRWAVPGGPAWLALPGEDRDRNEVRTQIDFLVEVHDLERIVLITHFGCAWYGRRFQETPEQSLALQTADVVTAAAVLRSWHPQLHVDGFIAMRKYEWISFHRIPVEGGTFARQTS